MADITEINSRNLPMRIALVGVMLLALLFSWFSIRWQLGNMIADLTPAADPNAAEVAAVAIRLAPADPRAHLLAAASEPDTAAAINNYDQVIRAAPHDYRWRIELGRAYEQNNESGRAETEFRRAVELAPNHAAPRWHLGNFLLRQSREADALAELKTAAEHNQTYRDQVFSLLWDYFQKDATRLEQIVEEPAAQAHLAYFFAARGVAGAALRNWSRLSDADKTRFGYRAVLIADGLYIQRHFPEALSFAKEIGSATGAEPEKISNQSFERNVGEAEQSRFGWQIWRTEPKIEITTDGKVAHEGTRSLRATFRGFAKPALANIYQTVVVDPNQKYSLNFWVRTDNLKSQGLPMLEVLSGVGDTTLARSQPFTIGTTDWQHITLEFHTPENCSGIFIRTIRSYCGEECPISGSFWYDDFDLTRQ